MNECGYVVCCCPYLCRGWAVPEKVGYVNEGVGAPGAIGAIHSYHCHWETKREGVVCYLPEEVSYFARSVWVKNFFPGHGGEGRYVVEDLWGERRGVSEDVA